MKFTYHIGTGNSKAAFPRSVVKYAKKLTMVAGHTAAMGVTFNTAISRNSMHFFNIWPVLVYNLCEFECSNPTLTNNKQE